MTAPRDTRRRLAASLVALAALVASPAAARADALRVTAPSGGGLAALAVSVDLKAGVVQSRTCPTAAGCSADASPTTARIGLNLAGSPEVATEAKDVDLGDGRHVVHVRVQLAEQKGSARDVAWEAVLAAGESAPLFAGLTGFTTGDVGERTGTTLIARERDGATQYLIKGSIREDVRICGHAHGTPLSPELLDAKTLKWTPTGLQRLTVEQRDHARKLTLAARHEPAPRPLAELLVATGTSGRSSGAGLTDGDPTTPWTEESEGEGRGEFVVMRAAPEVPIARFAVVLPTSSTRKKGTEVAPSVFYLVTDTETFEVTVPRSAQADGGAYNLALPEPVKTSCVSLVLEEAAGAAAHPDVSVRELIAYSELDASGASFDVLAKALGGPRSGAAVAILKRGGDPALAAVEAAWEAIDPAGRAAALDVAIGNPSCDAGAGILVRGVADLGKELAHAARQKILRCGPAAVKGLVLAVKAGDKKRIAAAPLLAQIDPDAAVEALVPTLGEGAKETRAAVRSALRTSLAHAERPRIAALIAESGRAPGAKLDLLRAATPRLGEMPAEANAAIAELARGAPMETRYLLVGPLVELAKTKDAASRALLGALAKTDSSSAVRTAAVEALARAATDENDALLASLPAAANDSAPRVQEAALVGLAELPPSFHLAPQAVQAGLAQLGGAGFGFVRVAALAMLARAPRAEPTDTAVAKALDDVSPRVRAAAAMTLGARHATSAGPALLTKAQDKDEDLDVREAATFALGDVCDARAIDALTQLAHGASQPMANDVQVRTGAAAIVALGKLHPKDLRQRLSAALSDAAPKGARELAQKAVAAAGSCR